jgi:hypothetical protein
MARQSSKEKTVNAVKEETNTTPKENIKVIQTINNIKLRKFPNLNEKDIIGISPIDAKYKIEAVIINHNGTFYKLSNGNFMHLESEKANIITK